ncbi:LacI family DNA-binding transcriptional regulator [Phytoactinopolyspora halotolerans]|uniref:LacI family transcriptional regulator n=1 Tax=Phytoactinopolyspora halotolerans TaxID=1981512 RepID=A0A6L9SC33_9ACTN|nr:LacI family DNA-binding transcriptional regulator [Phytoactinopolyspora halotolerans]NEE02234.1 LacI family transcriptional regulator [Phytoactinopolyspora halotolerans]
MARTASLKAVAAEAGVSISTVSRAFTRPELIGADTRKQILAIADRLGYRPNRSARGLVTGRTALLAVLLPDIANPFFPPLVRAVEDTAYEKGYSVLLMDTDEHPERESKMLRDLAGQADGVIVCSPRSRAGVIREAAERTPVVLVNRAVDGIASITCRTRDGIRQTVDHLHALGHRDIVYVSGPASSWSDRERRDSARRQARKLGMAFEVLGPYPATFSGGMLAADALAASGATAAVAFDDIMAMGILRRLTERGFDVPGQFSVSGCDDILFAAMAYPPLTSIASPIADAGRTAVRLLVDQLDGLITRDQQLSLSGELVVRGSTGPAPRHDERREARRASR